MKKWQAIFDDPKVLEARLILRGDRSWLSLLNMMEALFAQYKNNES